MKKCPICGNQYAQGDMCPICGMLLIDTETNSAVVSEPQKKSRFSVKKKSDKPVIEEPVMEEPLIEEPVEERPMMEEPVIEEPVVEEPVIEEPVVETPTVEEPVIEKPVVKKPVKREEQEEDIYGLGVKPERSRPQTQSKPVSRRSRSNDDGKITISFHPAYAVAVVVAILLIVAIVFIVRGVKAKNEAEEMYQTVQEAEGEEQVMSDELTDEELAAKKEMASENVDEIDLVENVEDTAIHNYQIVISDASWSQAKAECEAKGGYLVRINSPEEYNYIINMLYDGGYSKYHFYLGGRRDIDARGYFWVDENNQFMGELLNGPNSWTNGSWYNGEPSFEDVGSDANGNIQENVMNLFCVKDIWYLNDSSDDMAFYYPELLSGKIGYIVEFE